MSPLESKSSFPPSIEPNITYGIVFYVYGGNECNIIPRYMMETDKNVMSIHSLYHNVPLFHTDD